MAEKTKKPEQWSGPPLIMLESVFLFPDESSREFLPKRSVDQIAANIIVELEQRGIDPRSVVFASSYAVRESFESARKLVSDSLWHEHVVPREPTLMSSDGESWEWHELPDDAPDPLSFEGDAYSTGTYGHDIEPEEVLEEEALAADRFEDNLARVHENVEEARAAERGDEATYINVCTVDELDSMSDPMCPSSYEAVAFEFGPDMVGEVFVLDPTKLSYVGAFGAEVYGQDEFNTAVVCSFSVDIVSVLETDFFDSSSRAELRRGLEADARVNENRIEELQQQLELAVLDSSAHVALQAEMNARLHLRSSLLRQFHTFDGSGGEEVIEVGHE